MNPRKSPCPPLLNLAMLSSPSASSLSCLAHSRFSDKMDACVLSTSSCSTPHSSVFVSSSSCLARRCFSDKLDAHVLSTSSCSAPPSSVAMIINEWYVSAFVGLAISGATDWLDGFLARKMGINYVVGSYLDPLADKVLIGCVALAMVENNLLHFGLVGLVVLRDALLVGGAVYNRASSLDWKWKRWSDFVNLDGTRPEKVEPLFISKVNTVFQLILVVAALLQPELGTAKTQVYINYLSWLVAGTTMASTAGYGAQYMRMRNRSLPTVRSC